MAAARSVLSCPCKPLCLPRSWGWEREEGHPFSSSWRVKTHGIHLIHLFLEVLETEKISQTEFWIISYFVSLVAHRSQSWSTLHWAVWFPMCCVVPHVLCKCYWHHRTVYTVLQSLTTVSLELQIPNQQSVVSDYLNPNFSLVHLKTLRSQPNHLKEISINQIIF